jgi:glycosyltransferase involved in cell wall biosynthesis
MAIVLLSMVRHRQRWVKYAGNWQPGEREAWSYTFQRWWLNQGLHRGVVSINGEWANQPEYVHSFLNPSLTENELIEAKALSLQKEISSPVRLLFVGRVEHTKGVGSALKVISQLKEIGLRATLDVVGDGPERIGFEGQAKAFEIDSLVKFHGWLPKPKLSAFYAQSHLVLLPTRCSEGWPKVLSEAMAYGAVPITSAVSCIPQLLKKFETGQVVEPDDIAGICRAVLEYCERPSKWKKESERAVSAAQLFTYDNYLESVRLLLKVA